MNAATRGLAVCLLLAAGTTLTVVGSQLESAIVVVTGVCALVIGLMFLRPLSQRLLDWMERRRL